MPDHVEIYAGDYPLTFPMAVTSPCLCVDASFNGVVFISGSGNNVQGPNISNTDGFMIKNHPNSLGSILVFYHGGYSGSGYPIGTSEYLPFIGNNLNLLDFAVLSNSASACWIKI